MSLRPNRLRGAYGALDRDQRFAALAALGLLVAMFLPWYEKNVVITGTKSFANDSISAFGAVSFVEAAIFLVAAGVIALLLARADERPFHLPGGDGMVIFVAGLWATLLIFYRVFDRPDVSGDGGTVGIQWGFFVAFIAAGALAAAGQRIRVAGRPEPHLAAAEGEPDRAARRRTTRGRRAPEGRHAGQATPRHPRATRADATPPDPPRTAPTRPGAPRAAARPEAPRAAARPDAPPRHAPDPNPDEQRTAVVPRSEARTEVAPRPRDRRVTRDDARELVFEDPSREPPRDDEPPLRPGEVPRSARDGR